MPRACVRERMCVCDVCVRASEMSMSSKVVPPTVRTLKPCRVGAAGVSEAQESACMDVCVWVCVPGRCGAS
jgi:hypothetical protein